MPRAQGGGEVCDNRIDRPLGRRIGRERANRSPSGEGRQEDNAAALSQDRQRLLDQEERRPDIDGEELIEVLDSIIFDRFDFGDACIDHQDIEPAADDAADVGGQVRGHGVHPAAGGADLLHHRVGFGFTVCVMNQWPGAGAGEGHAGGPADAAGCDGHQRGFSWRA
jgi:hypothetical protein